MPSTTPEDINAWYQGWLNDILPLAYVALDDGNLVGSFSLQWTDGVRPDLSPWLGDLVIAPAYRCQGIGKQLVNFAVQKTKAFGFFKLYLFTFDKRLKAYYSNLGWKMISEDTYDNKPVIVMSKPTGLI